MVQPSKRSLISLGFESDITKAQSKVKAGERPMKHTSRVVAGRVSLLLILTSLLLTQLSCVSGFDTIGSCVLLSAIVAPCCLLASLTVRAPGRIDSCCCKQYEDSIRHLDLPARPLGADHPRNHRIR